VATVLTGMGSDGLAGCRMVRSAGGVVIAQDQQTSVVYGMPKAVVDAGMADEVLPLDKIGPFLAEKSRAR
jgi:two-component system chemotaxis response regulator CheB